MTMLCGIELSDGRANFPSVGPLTPSIRASSIWVTTFSKIPYPYCGFLEASYSSNPVATTIAPTSSSIISSFCSKSIASTLQTSRHLPHSPPVSSIQCSGSMEYTCGTDWAKRMDIAFLSFTPQL